MSELEQIPTSNQDGVRCRSDIQAEIESIYEEREKLRIKLEELYKENCLLSDDEQWYTEKEEEQIISRRPKKTETKLIGRVNWNESFKDEDTNEVIWIHRTKVVRVDGEWL
jgi:hypothetical protein